jgi:hypothetical protein
VSKLGQHLFKPGGSARSLDANHCFGQLPVKAAHLFDVMNQSSLMNFTLLGITITDGLLMWMKIHADV